MLYKWDLGSPFATYPFVIHDLFNRAKPGYNLVFVDPELSTIHIRSTSCTNSALAGSSSCSPCLNTTENFTRIQNQAKQPPGCLQHGFLSYSQLANRLEEVKNSRKDEIHDRLNAAKALARLRKHSETWGDILDLLGEKDVPGLHRIFKISKELNWGVEKLLEQMKKAVEGTYHPKSYSKLDLDLATTIYELGGGAALHALHRSHFAFPSRTTILFYRRPYRLQISTGSVRFEDILANIKTMFQETKIGHKRVGITLSMDEIASDGRLCYLPECDDIAGLCEHAASELSSVRMGTDLTVMRCVVQAVREGKVHVGQEVFVAAFARNDEADYGAKPVLLLPTCKQGSYQGPARLISMLRQAWKMSPYGEVLHGPIWSIASDGDPKRRPALYLHCMVRELKPPDALFDHLGNLPGLNLWTGSGGETQDLDYKHDFKRICKLLCTREGILVKKVMINKSLLAMWLERLTDVDWSQNSIFSLLNPNMESSIHERVHALLSPKDTQDVPRAIKLLNLTADVRNIESSSFNPSERSTHSALSILGEMLEALLEPFINPEFTLSEQITSLVKFAHIACALFHEHESAFMPNHLYSDLQCMVRTAIFRVAHTKNLDPSLKVFLCLLGDDVLEILFGRSRMIGGHSPNVDVDELRNRFESARRLDGIFQDHPEWERRPQRLKLTRSRDVDHLAPRHWTKELRASSCDLSVCWKEGVRRAEGCLSKAGYSYNFAEFFTGWKLRGVDLMRPRGGKYPGISSEVDRSLGEAETQERSLGPGDGAFGEVDTRLLSFNGQAALDEEARSRSESREEPHSIWMKLQNGQPGHKKTILRVFMDPALDIDYHKSHDRLLRVRYFSIGGDGWDRSKAHIFESLRNNVFQLNSLYASLICTDTDVVSLAILHCTSLKSGSQYLDQAPMDEISLPISTWDVTGQILSLIPIYDRTSGLLSWVWNGGFVALDPATSKPTKSAASTGAPPKVSATKIRHVSFSINGRLIYPLRPDQMACTLVDNMGELDGQFRAEPLKSDEETWIFKQDVLASIRTHLVERLDDDEDAHSKLPIFGRVREGEFPYTAVGPLDPSTTIDHTAPSIRPPSGSSSPQACTVCHRQVAGPDRQNHIGSHILRKLRGVEEKLPNGGVNISLIYPCGFCGQSTTNGTCKVSISRGKAVSTCQRSYNFMIHAAAKSSQLKPCTNIPIQCVCCDQVHWKYNILRHLEDRHPSWKDLRGEAAKIFAKSIEISNEEQSKLGIPESNYGVRKDVHEAYDIRRMGRRLSIHNHRGDSPRSTRISSNQEIYPPPPPTFSLPDQLMSGPALPHLPPPVFQQPEQFMPAHPLFYNDTFYDTTNYTQLPVSSSNQGFHSIIPYNTFYNPYS